MLGVQILNEGWEEIINAVLKHYKNKYVGAYETHIVNYG